MHEHSIQPRRSWKILCSIKHESKDLCQQYITAILETEHVVISMVALGLSRTLVGMGAVAVPACHRQGPMLQPWADPVRLPMSWDSSEDSYCDH